MQKQSEWPDIDKLINGVPYDKLLTNLSALGGLHQYSPVRRTRSVSKRLVLRMI